jgi:hypothetical protein
VSIPGDYLEEMQRLPIDIETADRILGGAVAPADAPPGYSRVAALVAEVESSGEEVMSAEAFVAVLAQTVRSSPRQNPKSRRGSFVPRIRFAVALAGALLVGTTGLALAGSLPGAAQDIASEMLAKVGVTVPGPNSNAGDHPKTRGSSSDHPVVTPTSSGKGAEISDLATSDLTGLEKGAAVSAAASDGKSKAGQEHPAPVETPNTGGTGAVDTASGGASSAGASKASGASGGHSSAGSGNAAGGKSHRP